jgi:hypothetical protein
MNNCQPNCGCKFEVDSSCVRYTGGNLGTTSINTGDTVEESIIKIDAAINNFQQFIENNQVQPIEGPINRVVKFGPPSTPLLPSQTIDDGISLGVNSTPDPLIKMNIESSTNQSGLKVSSFNNGKEAIQAVNQAVGANINKGIISSVTGSSSANVGADIIASGASNNNVGISATALGGTNNYSAQLKDGSETPGGGKFLKDTGNGKANWNYIYLADIQDYQASQPFVLTPATTTVLGGVKIGSGISVTPDGTISVNQQQSYTLPVATSNILGGVKIGSGINVTVDGTISTTLPIATTSVLGGVIVGSGLAITQAGVLSVNVPVTAGRGIAVFVQTAQPTQANFNTAYGTVSGFGINNLPGANVIKPGDLWIDSCTP